MTPSRVWKEIVQRCERCINELGDPKYKLEIIHDEEEMKVILAHDAELERLREENRRLHTHDCASAISLMKEENRRLEDALVGLMKSSDASWYSGKHGGHDWREAIDNAHMVLVKRSRRAKEGEVKG